MTKIANEYQAIGKELIEAAKRRNRDWEGVRKSYEADIAAIQQACGEIGHVPHNYSNDTSRQGCAICSAPMKPKRKKK